MSTSVKILLLAIVAIVAVFYATIFLGSSHSSTTTCTTKQINNVAELRTLCSTTVK